MGLTGLRSTFDFSLLFTLLERDLKFIFLANLVGSFGDGLYAYILPYYLKETLAAAPVQVGLLYATTNVFAALTLLASGLLGDRFDRKKLLILGWVFWVPVPLFFAFAQNWLQMLPGMILWGVYIGPPVSTAYILTVVRKDKLTLTLATISSAYSLGYVLSPALGGYIAGALGMKLVFFLAFVFYGIASLLLFLVKSQVPNKTAENDLYKEGSRWGLLKNRKLIFLSVFMGLVMFTMFIFRPFIPTFLADIYRYNSFEIGILGSFTFLGSAILAVGLGRVGDRFKKSYALAAALMFVGFSLFLLVLFGNFVILLFTHFLIGASFLSWSLTGAIIGPRAPESARAFSVAVPLMIGMFGSVLAPYLGGLLYELSPYYPFYLGICATIFLTVLALAKLD